MNNPLLNFKNRILFLFLFAFLFFSCTAFFPTEQDAGYPAIITSVIDGDTVTIRFNTDILPSGCNRTEKVRLIGINTPELTINPPEYYAKNAYQAWFGSLPWDYSSNTRHFFISSLAFSHFVQPFKKIESMKIAIRGE